MQFLMTLVLCRLHGMMECWNIGKYFTGQDIEGNSILPDSEFFKSSVDVYSIHGLFIPSTVLFFNQMEHECTQYSIIPLFHHSNCERSELSSLIEFLRNHRL